MDERFVTSNHKIQKLKGESINNCIRNIDDLLEAILAHILSFLCMKDAVRTSVLSKKWEFLWTSIPNLEFMESNYPNEEIFVNIVDRVLLQRGRAPIKKFFLDCKTLYSASRVNEWITAAVRHSIEKCTVRLIEVDETYMLPCLFKCDTLVYLNIDIRCTLRLPSQIHLPNHRVLSLHYVIFLDECSTQSLFSSPAIETLNIYECSWVTLSTICISSPKLKHLSIDEIWIIDGNGADRTLDYYCEVMICDCNLVSFNLSGPMFNEYLISNLSVDNASLSIEHDTRVADQAMNSLIMILQGLHAVQTLSFQGSTLCGLDCSCHGEDDGTFDQVPSCFSSSLKSIEIGGLFYGDEKGELYGFKILLKHATVLEEFNILSCFDNEDGTLEEFHGNMMSCPLGSKNCEISFL